MKLPVSRLIVASLSALLMAPCLAQDNSGWGALGEMLGGRKDRDNQVYNDAYREAVDMEAARRQAQQLGEASAVARDVANSRVRLSEWWVAYGLPVAEADAVANTFIADSRQYAINARAHRDGHALTIRSAVAAYERYDYLLANQLLLAAALLPDKQN